MCEMVKEREKKKKRSKYVGKMTYLLEEEFGGGD